MSHASSNKCSSKTIAFNIWQYSTKIAHLMKWTIKLVKPPMCNIRLITVIDVVISMHLDMDSTFAKPWTKVNDVRVLLIHQVHIINRHKGNRLDMLIEKNLAAQHSSCTAQIVRIENMLHKWPEINWKWCAIRAIY